MNSLFQGVFFILLGIALFLYKIKNPSKSPDVIAGDLNMSIAILLCFVLSLSILFGWMTPFSF